MAAPSFPGAWSVLLGGSGGRGWGVGGCRVNAFGIYTGSGWSWVEAGIRKVFFSGERNAEPFGPLCEQPKVYLHPESLTLKLNPNTPQPFTGAIILHNAALTTRAPARI